MAGLDKGKDKIQMICEMLQTQTLAPAQQEAKTVVAAAEREAEKIVHEAHQEARRIIEKAHKELENEKKAVHMALKLAAKQATGSLKQDLESKIFDRSLKDLIVKASSQPNPIAELLQALVKAIEKSGLDTQISAIIPKTCPPEKVLPLLMQEVVHRLKMPLQVGPFEGGIQVRLENDNLCLDISDQAIRELLAAHLRKEFRKYVFGS